MWKIIHVYTHHLHTYLLLTNSHTHTQSHNQPMHKKAFNTQILRTRDTPNFFIHLLHSGFIHTIVATRHEVCFHSIGKRQTLITKCMWFGSTIWLRNKCELSVCARSQWFFIWVAIFAVVTYCFFFSPYASSVV